MKLDAMMWEGSEPSTPELFAACNYLDFFADYPVANTRFTIMSGVYPTGNGALVLMHGGQAECKITVNMVNAGPYSIDLNHDQFCVVHNDIQSYAPMLLELGIFEAAGDYVEVKYYGTPQRYADIWSFKRCTVEGHIEGPRQIVGTLRSPGFNQAAGHYAITCLSCKQERERVFKERIERLEAADAISRLRNMPRER